MVLLAGGALLIATPGMAANTFATGPATGLGTPGLQQRGLPPGTPEQSTGMAPGTLRQESPRSAKYL